MFADKTEEFEFIFSNNDGFELKINNIYPPNIEVMFIYPFDNMSPSGEYIDLENENLDSKYRRKLDDNLRNIFG